MVLMLSKEIYPEEQVLRGIRAYSSLAAISVCDAGERWQCAFSSCKFEEGQTVREFENYLIDMGNSTRNDRT